MSIQWMMNEEDYKDKQMREIKRGFYKMREFPNLSSEDLHWVWVKSINTLGDGSKSVTYIYNWPFPIKEEMSYEEFIKNIVIEQNK